MPHHLRILLVLAFTQISGWGAINVLPVIADAVAEQFRTSLPSVFAGTSVMFVAMGLAAPAAGRAFRRFGTRRVMAAGAALIGLGLGLLALSTGLPMFWIAWALIGLAGSMFLTTSAYAYLAETLEDRARGLIATLMLVTGLAGTVFWPLTAVLDGAIGWRGALSVYAAAMVAVVGPCAWFGLPPTGPGKVPSTPRRRGRRGPAFPLLAAAIAANSFVTFGIEATGIALLRVMGMDLATSVAVSSLLGISKVGGRVIDVLGGRRWDGLSTGIVSGAMIPMGLAVIWIGGAGPLSVVGYLMLFGIGSGAFAVARATMPLVFFAKAEYAAAMADIALPMNLVTALAPPVIASMMAGAGARTTFAVLAALSVAAFATLLVLNGMRTRSDFEPCS